MVSIGATVTGAVDSEVLQIVEFLDRVLSEPAWAIDRISGLLSGTTSLPSELFSHRFPYLNGLAQSPHAQILAAESSDELRGPSEERQKMLGYLTERAVAILDEAGNSGDQARDKIQLTLLALGSNSEAAELFGRGRISLEVEPGSSRDLAVVPTDRFRSEESVAERHRLGRWSKEVRALQQKAEKLELRASRRPESGGCPAPGQSCHPGRP